MVGWELSFQIFVRLDIDCGVSSVRWVSYPKTRKRQQHGRGSGPSVLKLPVHAVLAKE